MPNGVTLISEKGAPLSCAEVDANYLALLNRTNHMGTQPASSIYDLEAAVNSLTSLSTIQTNLSELEDQVSDFQYQLMGTGGHLNSSLNSLSSSLNTELSSLRSLINNNTNSITDLRVEDEALHTRIDSILSNVDGQIGSIASLLQCLEDGTCVLVPSPPENQGDLILGYDDETDALLWGLPISLFCGSLVAEAFEVGTNSRIDLGTFN